MHDLYKSLLVLVIIGSLNASIIAEEEIDEDFLDGESIRMKRSNPCPPCCHSFFMNILCWPFCDLNVPPLDADCLLFFCGPPKRTTTENPKSTEAISTTETTENMLGNKTTEASSISKTVKNLGNKTTETISTSGPVKARNRKFHNVGNKTTEATSRTKKITNTTTIAPESVEEKDDKEVQEGKVEKQKATFIESSVKKIVKKEKTTTPRPTTVTTKRTTPFFDMDNAIHDAMDNPTTP